jgi:hypothetical protein
VGLSAAKDQRFLHLHLTCRRLVSNRNVLKFRLDRHR